MGAYFFFRKLLLTVACMLPGILAFSQKNGDYRSVSDGDWNDLTTWQIFTDSGWVTPAVENGVPGVSPSLIQIVAGTKVIVTTAVIAGQVRIDPKATLIIADSASFEVANGPGSDMQVGGTLEVSGSLLINGTISLQEYSLYIHRNQNSISSAKMGWHPLSRIEISGGGKMDWLLNAPVTALCFVTITNNSTVSFIADVNAETLTSHPLNDTGLFIASGSVADISSIKKFVPARNSSVIVNGTLISEGIIDLSENNSSLQINGKLISSAQFINSNTLNLKINDDAVFEHMQDGGAIPSAKWGSRSNCILSGIKTKMPQGLNQVLGNLMLNSAFSSDIYLNQTIDCQGDFTIENPSSGLLVINTDSFHHSVLVGGNFIFKSGALVLANAKGDASIQVSKNFVQSGGSIVLKKSVGDAEVFTMGDFIKENGSLSFNSNDSASRLGTSKIAVQKNFIQNGGATNFSQNDGIGSLYVERNFSYTGGVITASGSGYGDIHFSGDSVQLFDVTEKFQNTINIYADSLSFLQMATESTRMTSSGKFVLCRGATIGVKHQSGLVAETTQTGHIYTSARIYEDGANVVFNGTTPQVTGSAFENFIPTSVTINNPTKTSQLTVMTISGDLLINEGELYSRNNNINIGGNWINNGYYNFGNNSVVTFNGAESQNISGKNSTTFHSLIINNNKGVNLIKNISVAAQLTLVNGNLNVGSNILTMEGNSNPIYSSSFSNNRMIVLDENGLVRKNANSFKEASYFFPIGNISEDKSYYTPIDIAFARVGTFNGYATVSLSNKKHPASPDDQNYLARFWTVKQEGYTKFLATVTTTFDSADVVGSLEALRMGKFSHDSTVSGWVSYPDPAKANTFTTTQITSFSDFTGIGLVVSTARKDSIGSMARMAVANNLNRAAESKLKIFPNPVSNGPLQLSLYNFPEAQLEIVITNAQGQKVLQKSQKNTSSQAYFSIEFDNKLPRGFYYLTITSNDKTWFSSFIKQ